MAEKDRAPGKPISEEAKVQFRLAHLTMVQGVIGRMAGYSSTVKNFSITVSAATVALAFDKGKEAPLWIAIGAVLLFGALDAYYLALERGFRATYESVAAAPLSEAGNLSISPHPSSRLGALLSFSVWPFYFPQLVVAAWLIFCYEGLK